MSALAMRDHAQQAARYLDDARAHLLDLNGGLTAAKRAGVVIEEDELALLDKIAARLRAYMADVDAVMPAPPDVRADAVVKEATR